MTTPTPWMKFYPQDWRADEKLRLCSLAARGLWMEMLAIMHRSERYGQLLISGHAPTEAQLAVQVGASTPEVSELCGQLEAAGVFSRTGSGVIYSRRMTRDYKKVKIARQNGKTGGNPSLRKQKVNSALDKGSDKGGLNPQKLEARYSDTNVSGDKPPGDPVKDLFDVGVSLLTSSGKREGEARSLVGKWRKVHGDGATMAALLDCRGRGISNPVEWMARRLSSVQPSTDDYLAFVSRKHANG